MPSIRTLPPPPVVIRHRPQLVIAGFLGAGKTTLLRNLLGALQEYDITSDVILNDYENAELDAETLRDKASAISPLSASCACCGGLEEMVNLALAAQDSRADCLLIELNGTADPVPLIETFTLLDEKLTSARAGRSPLSMLANSDAATVGRTLKTSNSPPQPTTSSAILMKWTKSV